MAEENTELFDRAREISLECQEVLHGQGSAVQSLVLADLLAIWLAGHFVVEELGGAERPQTDNLREALPHETH
jgi:DNA-nicking Smr family endonuclease